jgi:hypothetical protein
MALIKRVVVPEQGKGTEEGSTHLYILTYMHTHTHIHAHTHMHTNIHIHACTNTYNHLYTYLSHPMRGQPSQLWILMLNELHLRGPRVRFNLEMLQSTRTFELIAPDSKTACFPFCPLPCKLPLFISLPTFTLSFFSLEG